MTKSDKRFVVFARLVFVLVGGGMIAGGLYVCVKEVQTARRIRGSADWAQVDAEILDLSRKVTRSTRGSEHVRLNCSYRYDFQGRDYVSDVIALQESTGELGRWQDALFSDLQQAYEAAKPVPCYVNPADPADATLDRSFRAAEFWFAQWCGSALAVAGVLVLLATTGMLRRQAKRSRLQREYPAKPWLWDPAWHLLALRPKSRRKFLYWSLAVYSLVAAVPLVLFVVPTLRSDGAALQGYGVAGCGLAAPVALLVIACVATFRGWSLRHTRLHLDAIPIRTGEPATGEVVLAPTSCGPEALRLKLELVKRVQKGRGTSTDKWVAREIQIARAATNGDDKRPRYPFSLATEPDWPSHDDDDHARTTTWELSVICRDGIGWRLRFGLPVFACDTEDVYVEEEPEVLSVSRDGAGAERDDHE